MRVAVFGGAARHRDMVSALCDALAERHHVLRGSGLWVGRTGDRMAAAHEGRFGPTRPGTPTSTWSHVNATVAVSGALPDDPPSPLKFGILEQAAVQVDRLVVVLPATPSDWFAVGMIAAAVPNHHPPVALVVPTDVYPELLAANFPLIVDRATLVTETPARVVEWVDGTLFQNLLPPDPVPPRRAPGSEDH